MAVNKQILFLIMLFSYCVICLLVYTELKFYKITEEHTKNLNYKLIEQSNVNKSIKELIFQRKQRIKEYCENNSKESHLQYGVTRKLLIDRENNLTWCPICKAGSTIWMKVFAVLGGELNPDTLIPESNTQINKLARQSHPFLGAMKIQILLNTTTKFFIVRHPFERLLSAFRDKLEDENKAYYHNKFGKYIIKWYRLDGDNRTVPYFEEFLKYIVHERSFDEHWRPYYQECAPCFIKYDFILKMENFGKELEYLVEYLNNKKISHIINKNNKDNINPLGRTNNEINKQYFSKISLNLLKDIYKIYKKDFIMFDYEPDVYFNMTKK